MQGVKSLISKDEALELIKKTSKFSHALIVSDVIGRIAKKLGEDEKKWEIVGLLHDLDYDRVKEDLSKHGVVASRMLKGKLSQDCLYAIKSHDCRTGFQPKSRLDKALIVADTLAIIIEKMEKRGELSVRKIEEEIEKISRNNPWYKDNLQEIEELGIKISEVIPLKWFLI